MTETVLLVGCGNMGRAMLAGWLKAIPSLKAHVVEPTDALREQAASLGAKAVAAAADLPDLMESLNLPGCWQQAVARAAQDR